MSARAHPFSSRAVLAMLVVGSAAFLLFLYAIAAGWDDRVDSSGAGHAASNGLNGYAALVRLLERQGLQVSTSRDKGRLDDQVLLVLTPQFNEDPEKFYRLINARRQEGPTLVILPKWFALDASRLDRSGKFKRGWVVLSEPHMPEWLRKLGGDFVGTDLRLVDTQSWDGLNHRGKLATGKAQSMFGPHWTKLVGDGHGGALVAFDDDGGYYPTLLPLAGREVDEDAERRWALTIVAEPDLFNNQGLADVDRARLAVELVKAAREEPRLPVVFDLTLAGLGASKNLLTLACEPPFLAATLCLLLAALVIAWRALRRFGPPLAEAAATAFGKAQLARNAGGLIERSRRLHLLGPPYAALIAARIAARLGVRDAQAESRDAAAARLLDSRSIAPDYPARLEALRNARKAGELIRAAGALKSIERTLAA
jgi:hypothetical protein